MSLFATVYHELAKMIGEQKYLLINIILVTGFIINTALLNKAGTETSDQNNLHVNAGRFSLRTLSRREAIGSESQDNILGKSSRWIIVNLKQSTDAMGSSSQNQGTLSFLDDVSGWSILVVGPAAKTRHGCSSCLKPPNEASLMSAFATAIDRGAKQIYMVNTLHDVKKALKRMTSSELRGLTYSGRVPFKPCSHFVQPLFGTNRSYGDCFDGNWLYSYKLKDFPKNQIISTCPDCGSPCPECESGKVYCDSSTPNVAVQKKTFSQSAFGNSLWAYDSFWALFYYVINDESSSPSEALRLSYIIQQLLWETQTTLTFVRSHGLHLDTDGKVSDVILRRRDVVLRVCRAGKIDRSVEEMRQFLEHWTCEPTSYVLQCVNDLIGKLYGSNLLSMRQFKAIEKFMTEIQSTSYIMPIRDHKEDQSKSFYFDSKAKSVYFWPSFQKRVWSQNPFHEICSASSNRTLPVVLSPPPLNKPPIESVVLIIVFKENDAAMHIQMTKFYDYLYGQHFKHIIYCATGTDMIELFAKMYPQPMTVIDLEKMDSKMFPYACVSEAMKMNQEVEGYLQIDSNTLLNPWSIEKLLDKIDIPWFSQVPLKARLSQLEVVSFHGSDKKWPIWNDFNFGKKRFTESLEDLVFISKMIDEHLSFKNHSIDLDILKFLVRYNEIVKRFLGEFDTDSLGSSVVHYGESVIFYVPARYREHFIILSEQFRRYTIHSDLLVPSLLKTLDAEGRMLSLTGSLVPYSRTYRLTAAFRPDNVFLFPWQMFMISAPTRSKFMCDAFLPILLSRDNNA